MSERPLLELTRRTPDDPAIAFLDAWAMVGDVLTFYQERYANEGYLRTACQRRSVQELARLIGYELRPGVASSVHLAFTMEQDHEAELPVGTRAQSVPGPGETAQTFETIEALEARWEWNELKPRVTRRQSLKAVQREHCIYLKGRNLPLRPNDPLLVMQESVGVFFRVASIEPDSDSSIDRSAVFLRAWEKDPLDSAREKVSKLRKQISRAPLKGRLTRHATVDALLARIEHAADLGEMRDRLDLSLFPRDDAPVVEKRIRDIADGLGVTSTKPKGNLYDLLTKPKNPPPSSTVSLERDPTTLFGVKADGPLRILVESRPALGDVIEEALRNVKDEGSVLKVYRVRHAAVFGYNAPSEISYDRDVNGGRELTVKMSDPMVQEEDEDEKVLYLDAIYDSVPKGACVGIGSAHGLQVPLIESATEVVRSKYGLNSRATRLGLSDTWFPKEMSPRDKEFEPGFSEIRSTMVLLPGETIEVADAPLPARTRIQAETVVLDDLYPDLETGRWLIVAGDRDVFGRHVPAAELVMLSAVDHSIGNLKNPYSKPSRTKLTFSSPLSYRYFPETVTIYGNVARATHGETRSETLGSGDGTLSLQAFTLKQSPLTFVSAATPAGASSTLEVRVDGVEWHEAESLADLGPRDRGFVTRMDDESNTTVVFGNGVHGARVPSGVENVTAVYRRGIGQAGNVDAETITLLPAKPLGLKEVINPIAATGGADQDSADQGRRNAPLAVMALDRLVSVQDYADFARTFAGIAKAQAYRAQDGSVQVTIAGVDDIVIEPTTDLYQNLLKALRDYGEPLQKIELMIRSPRFLLISAKVAVDDDELWELIEPEVRAALLDAFSFDRRDIGQDALLSEAVRVIQRVRGVAHVDVDVFGRVPVDSKGSTPAKISKDIEDLLKVQEKSGPASRVRVASAGQDQAAEIAYLSAELPETLILTEWPR
ncbi:MAG TPA: putative baseplate assembly protein [Candidatus Eisenbacteria bacterium]|nr:putative baseplate assembly protein [Candidatus Eisenbacteria bacterium]